MSDNNKNHYHVCPTCEVYYADCVTHTCTFYDLKKRIVKLESQLLLMREQIENAHRANNEMEAILRLVERLPIPTRQDEERR